MTAATCLVQQLQVSWHDSRQMHRNPDPPCQYRYRQREHLRAVKDQVRYLSFENWCSMVDLYFVDQPSVFFAVLIAAGGNGFQSCMNGMERWYPHRSPESDSSSRDSSRMLKAIRRQRVLTLVHHASDVAH